MKATILEDRIDIAGISSRGVDWESLLDELNAEHVPGCYAPGKRMAITLTRPYGGFSAHIFRTPKTPGRPRIHEVLQKHGIATSPEPLEIKPSSDSTRTAAATSRI